MRFIAATGATRGRASTCAAYSKSWGGAAFEIDGHDFSQVVPALKSVKASGDSDQPTMIIAHTIKGKGVHFTEGKHEWHSKIATKDELRIIAKELNIEEALA